MPSLVKSILVTLRHIYFLQCSPCHEVDFVDLEARVYFPCCGCPSLGVVDFVDSEVLIYFLQCASFGGVDLFDPEARIFLQCAFFNWVDFADPKAPIFRFVLFW